MNDNNENLTLDELEELRLSAKGRIKTKETCLSPEYFRKSLSMTIFNISDTSFQVFIDKIFRGVGIEKDWAFEVVMWWVIECLADSELYDCKEEADEIFAAIQSWRNRKRDPDW